MPMTRDHNPTALSAGAAEVDITPPIGLPMDGYAARRGVNNGVHDPLSAQILVLDDTARRKRAALVTLDVLAVTHELANRLRRTLAALLDTEPDAVMVCASHTHAGPCGLQTWFPPGGDTQLDETLADMIAERLRAAARTALAGLRPVQIVYGAGAAKDICGDRNRPDRRVDSWLTALRFEATDGRIIAVVCHFACHPTVLGPENLLYSADLAGAARARLCVEYPGAVALYLNGAAGNISTRYTRHAQTFAEVERLGNRLGEQAVGLVRYTDHEFAGLAWGCQTLDLPFRDLNGVADFAGSAGSNQDRAAQAQAEGLALQAELTRAFADRHSQRVSLCALRIGRWRLVAVPGEAFDTLATTLRAANPYILVVGYANDYVGYFPTQQAIDDQTYEALSSPYDARAHEMLAETILNRLLPAV